MDLRTNLLATLLDNIDDDGRRLTILDIGSASPETVEFFSQYKCRLYFADIFSDPILNRNNDEIPESDLNEHFSRLLNYPAQTKFDICLFWDALNFLDTKALKVFSEVLSPFLSQASGVHGFSSLKATAVLPNQQYSIQAPDSLKLRPRQTGQAPQFLHPQIELNKLLYRMKVAKATLLSGGLLEMLFTVSN